MSVTFENQIASLIIKETEPQNAGLYVCKATNHLGFAETKSTVKVEEKPSAVFDSKLSNLRLKLSSEYLIEAEIRGYPIPQVTWTKEEKIIESTKQTIIKTVERKTTLNVKTIKFEDSGTYGLKVSNEAGENNYNFVLNILDRPGPPDAPVRCINIEGDCIELSWKPPKDDGGSQVLKYFIEKCEIKSKSWKEVKKIEANLLTYKVDKLVSGTEYMFRISAINEFGTSDATESEPILCKSPFGELLIPLYRNQFFSIRNIITDKPSPPMGPLLTSDNTETSFSLSWSPPQNDGNSEILEYTIEKKEVGKKVWQKVSHK